MRKIKTQFYMNEYRLFLLPSIEIGPKYINIHILWWGIYIIWFDTDA
jgi:hypothetical protein